MTIFTDDENRIVKSGINEYEIPENHPLATMSETKRLCYVYEENGSFYPYVSTDIIEKLEEVYAETNALNILLGVSNDE